jgi:hypothetical protein
VASAFKGNDAVILELFGEPWPDDNRDSIEAWRCWRDGGRCTAVPYETVGMQKLVDTVRATGATNVIGLSGVQFANSLTRWLAYKPKDPLRNVIASWHAYSNQICISVDCYDRVVAAVGDRVPVVATEFGHFSCDATWLNRLMSWLDSEEMGYVAWVWEVWGPECSSLALITDYSGTPTTSGQIYKAHIARLR